MKKRKADVLWFETDKAKRQEIATHYDDLPLTHWDLSARTFNMLMRHNPNMSIGDVIRTDESITEIRNLGENSYQELDEKVSELLGGVIDKLKQSLLDEPPKSTPVATKKDNQKPSPPQLPFTVQNLPLGYLHLNIRAYNALIKADITTIGDLFNTTQEELKSISGFGTAAIKYARQSLFDLTISTNEQGEVDWLKFAKAQGLPILPSKYHSHTPPGEIVIKLTKLINEILIEDFDERTWIIIQRRYGLEGTKKLPLEELGDAFGLTRERVRQIEEKAKETLKDVLLDNRYVNRKYRIHPEIQSIVKNLCQLLPSEPNQLVLEVDLLNRIQETYEIFLPKIKPSGTGSVEWDDF